MSEIALEEATTLFDSLPLGVTPPTLHPSYLVADSARLDDARPAFFAFRRGRDVWLNSFHLGRVPNSTHLDVQSAYGYGGPVATTTDATFVADAWAAWCHWCIENDVLAEFVRFHPMAKNWRFYAGHVFYDRETVAISLAAGDPLPRYSTRVRTAVRKAKKEGLVTTWNNDRNSIINFGEFYRQGMREIGALDFYLFGNGYFEAMSDLDFARLLTCSLGNKILAAGIFLVGPTVMEYHLSATTDEGRRLGATNLLLHSAATKALELGIDHLFLGGGTDATPDNRLLFFKRGFSETLFPFQVGTHVHQPESYERLSANWRRDHGKISPKTLFYR